MSKLTRVERSQWMLGVIRYTEIYFLTDEQIAEMKTTGADEWLSETEADKHEEEIEDWENTIRVEIEIEGKIYNG